MRYSIVVLSVPQARDPRTGEPCGAFKGGVLLTGGPAHVDESEMRLEFDAVRRAIDEHTALRLPWIEADAGVVFHVQAKRIPNSRR